MKLTRKAILHSIPLALLTLAPTLGFAQGGPGGFGGRGGGGGFTDVRKVM